MAPPKSQAAKASAAEPPAKAKSSAETANPAPTTTGPGTTPANTRPAGAASFVSASTSALPPPTTPAALAATKSTPATSSPLAAPPTTSSPSHRTSRHSNPLRHAAVAVPSVIRHSEDDPSRRSFTKKLQKRRPPRQSMEFPERLKQHGPLTEDEEVLRPNSQTQGVYMNLNQSIFGLIAAAGSTVDFNNRFEGQSSDEDEDAAEAEEEEGDGEDKVPGKAGNAAMSAVLPSQGKADKKRSKLWPKDLSQSTIFSKPSSSSGSSSSPRSGDRRRRSEKSLLRSLPSLKTKLSSKSSRHKSSLSTSSSKKVTGDRIDEEGDEDEDDERHTSQTPPSQNADGSSDHPAIQVTRTNRDRSDSVRSIAPVMSRMLEAKAELAARPSFDLDRRSADKNRDKNNDDLDDDDDAGGPSALARRLMEIFEFDKPEEVIDEYPCWLLQSVLLQGYMYITAHHICFYAYLPKKANEVAKSGYLAKSGKRNPKYNRYWFRLKGDVLAYYRDPSDLYFPHGQIDLRYGISATVSDKDKEGVHFQVVTHQRTYYFRADSAPSAKEWVKSLQRVIFRSHNEGDSVKISMPINNVIDIEETQTIVEFADTCKIRVIDNDETYAIDEYFFSFFDYGKEAVRVLRILIEDNEQQTTPSKAFMRKSLAEDRESEDSSNMFGEQAGAASASATPPRATIQTISAASDSRLLKMGKLNSAVRATLSPISPGTNSPRASGEIPRSSFDGLRASFSPSRRSFDASKFERPPHRSFSEHGSRSASIDRRRVSEHRQQSEKQDSSDSFVQSSMEDPSQASFSGLVASASDMPSSGSQILHGSEVFQSPTVIRRSNSATRRRDDTAVQREDSPRRSSTLPAKKLVHGATSGHLDESESVERDSMDSQAQAGGTPSQANLQNLAKYGSYPLQRAGVYAGWLNRQSRKMSTLLATESMGYVEKVSGMWKGGHRHYDEPPPGLRIDEDLDDGIRATGPDVAISNERFQAHFALASTEKLQATYFGYLMRVLPLYGKIYISNRSFCFRSMLPGTRTKLILPLRDIENSTKEKGFRFGFSGLVVVIRGHEELFFEFGQAEMRDDCAVTLIQGLESARFMKESGILNEDEKAGAETALAERDALQNAREEAASRQDEVPEVHSEAASAAAAAHAEEAASSAALQHKILRQSAMMTESPTILFDDPKASFLNFKPAEPMRITCLTIGSRGDVQPYIALGKGLLAEGHHVKIATHPEFEDWIRSHGLDYGRVEGDPGELLRICIENGTFTLQFLREANSKMRTWLDELLSSAWTACQDSDLLIESPSAMAGIHMAEKMQIPYFRAFTMPWTRTRAYPHAFIMPEHKMGGAYNYITYVMFDNVFWKATASQINRWRNKTLGLPNTTLEKMQPNKVPFLYNFSPSVVPPPLDYSDWIRVTGYWFLDEGTPAKKDNNNAAKDKDTAEPPSKTAWTPPKDLSDFIAKARADKKKLVYVGFGSILVPDPAKMTQEVIDAVLKADVRCILSKGWSDRIVMATDKKREASETGTDSDRPSTVTAETAAHDASKVEVPLPPEIFQIKSAPHDWLFAQIDAAAHHGGSGTTGASLRAGIPTIIRPFFGDQFFFGGRVEDLGVGICLKKWGAYSFGRALWEATNSERMIKKARILGEQIRQETGVATAIQCMYRDMEYAKSLVKAKVGKNNVAARIGATGSSGEDGTSAGADAYEDEEVPEESWTFVGDDVDPMQQSVILGPDGKAAVAGLGSKALGSRILGVQA